MNGHEFLESVFKRMSFPRSWGRVFSEYVTGGDIDDNWIEVTLPNGEMWVIKARKIREV